MQATIRLANGEDVEAIEQCITGAYVHYIKRIGKRPAPMDVDYRSLINENSTLNTIFVLEAVVDDQAKVAGVLVMQKCQQKVLLESVAVLPEYQGCGFGAMLLVKAEEYALDCGVSSLYLYTNVLMTENINYYVRKGYKELRRISEEGFERLYMSKPLG